MRYVVPLWEADEDRRLCSFLSLLVAVLQVLSPYFFLRPLVLDLLRRVSCKH